MKARPLRTLRTVADFHAIAGLPAPAHPLLSVVDYSQVQYQTTDSEIRWLQHFYCIGLKRDIQGKFRYGQQQYDFNAGIISLTAPGQVVELITTTQSPRPSGYLLCMHPDFIWNTALARKIKQYDYFGYAVNEALFLSDKEEEVIISVIRHIERECQNNIDAFSQSIIVAHLEVLLSYFERFYQRQFITRRKTNHQLLEQLETLLDKYFDDNELSLQGLPTAQYLAAALHISPNYLGSLLKSLTGLNTQQHIHERVISKAKQLLSTTRLSVSEIAYELGFEHVQSFNKLFKSKTNITPLAFRQSFN
jgi:AraC family transcriptional activator of pobA